MKKRSAFRLNGKPLPTIPGPILKIRNFCSKMKDGELLSTNELAATLGYSYKTFGTNRWVTDGHVEVYRARVRYPQIRVVWGNAKTIRELLKHKELLACS